MGSGRPRDRLEVYTGLNKPAKRAVSRLFLARKVLMDLRRVYGCRGRDWLRCDTSETDELYLCIEQFQASAWMYSKFVESFVGKLGMASGFHELFHRNLDERERDARASNANSESNQIGKTRNLLNFNKVHLDIHPTALRAAFTDESQSTSSR